MSIISLEGEVWVAINHPLIGDYSNRYMVSNKGRIKSYCGHSERILKPYKNKNNDYLSVGLYKEKKPKRFSIHRLVGLMFLETPNTDPNNLQINHIDEDKSNNCADNLEFVSARENCNYGSRNKRIKESQEKSTAFKEARKKVAAKQSKKVYQYDQNFNLLKIYKSLKDVFNQNAFDCSFIAKCCNGKRKNNTAYGYIWSYEAITKIS